MSGVPNHSCQTDGRGERLAQLVGELRAQGGRVTPQRMAILDALLAADHPTVEQIFERVRRTFSSMSIVTVYRTLAFLRELGQLVEVDSAVPVARYDGMRPYPHPHLICAQCGRAVDSPVTDVAALIDAVGTGVEDWSLTHAVLIYGLCPACRASGSSDAQGCEK